MATKSWDYCLPGGVEPEEPRNCPHCGQTIQPGDTVHWWDEVLWHTKPCP